MRVGLIGLGYMGSEYIKAIGLFEEMELVGIVSRTKKSLFEFGLDDNLWCDDIADLCLNRQCDAIIVSVSAISSFSVLEELMLFPGLVLMEKPLGLGIEEANKFLNLCEKAEGQYFIALNRRCYSNVLEVEKRLEQESGSCRIVTVIDQQDAVWARINGEHETIRSRLMYANSVHLIDLICKFCRGFVTDVQILDPFIDEKQCVVVARILFESGDRAFYTAYWNTPAPWQFTLSSGDSFFQFSSLEHCVLHNSRPRTVEVIDLSVIDKEFKPGLCGLLEQLLKQHFEGASDLISFREHLPSIQLIHRIYRV